MNVLKLMGYWLGRGIFYIVTFVFFFSFEIIKSVFLGLAAFVFGAFILYLQLGVAAWIFIRVVLWLMHKH